MKPSLIVSTVSLAALAACASNTPPPSSQEQSALVIEASTHLSTVSQYFVGATTTASVTAAIQADMTDAGCVTITANANTIQADFDGCVSVSGQFALDGTVNATIHAGGLFGATTVDLDTSALVAANLTISGSWTLDVSGILNASAMWTGTLDIAGAFDGSVTATVTVDLGHIGLCLDLSLDANASFQGQANANSASASGSADLAISVDGLVSCGGCPAMGQVHITVDGAADAGWTYGGSSGAVQGSGSVDVSIGIGGLGFGCPVSPGVQ